MNPTQRIEARMAEKRAELSRVVGTGDTSPDSETSATIDRLTAELRSDDALLTAAKLSEPDTVIDTGTQDPGRVELRQAVNIGNYLGKLGSLKGAERELNDELGIPYNAIPHEALEAQVEVRTDEVTGGVGTVGVNLANIEQKMYARTVFARVGGHYPRVPSGTAGYPTLTTAVTASARTAGAAQEGNATAFTIVTATPRSVSARFGTQIEQEAAAGTNLRGALAQNIMMALGDKVDGVAINGSGTAPEPKGIVPTLTQPTDASATVTWQSVVGDFAGGIDGVWAESLADVCGVVNVDTIKKLEGLFQQPDTSGARGELSSAAYLRQHAGGLFANKRMPDTATNDALALLCLMNRSMLDGATPMRLAVLPVWDSVTIDDPYTDSAKGVRWYTMHQLVGHEVAIVQPDAFKLISLQLA
ncbi:phage major capsid protein [Candidatus Poriferisodalis sp.]|uniref:phage major capsid protein n=1 Tax=Candidatus Poriferisodalis sp. TaxID=3101277 RepID=UPI003B02EB02